MKVVDPGYYRRRFRTFLRLLDIEDFALAILRSLSTWRCRSTHASTWPTRSSRSFPALAMSARTAGAGMRSGGSIDTAPRTARAAERSFEGRVMRRSSIRMALILFLAPGILVYGSGDVCIHAALSYLADLPTLARVEVCPYYSPIGVFISRGRLSWSASRPRLYLEAQLPFRLEL